MRHALLLVATLAVTRPLTSQATGGTLVVTNKTPATATIIDVASARVLATLPTGQGPHEVVAARNGSLAVVTDYGAQVAGSTLTVIDLGRLAVARTIALGEYRRPHGVVFLPGDSIVAVTSETNRAVLLVDVVRGQVLQAIPTEQDGSHMVGVTADGRHGFTGNIGSGTVSELDLATGRYVRQWAVPPQPEAINVTPDGREVWVGSNATGKVSVVDVASGTVTTAAEGFSWPYRVLFAQGASLVVMPDYRGEVVRFIDRASHRELGRMTFTGGGPQGVTLVGDGRTLALSLSAQGKVVFIDLASRRVVRELAAGETPDGVAWTQRTIAR